MLGSSSIDRAPSNRGTNITSSSGYGAVPAFIAFSSALAASINRFMRGAVLVAVRRIERIERRVDLLRIALIGHSGVEAAQTVHRHARVCVDQDEPVRLRQAVEAAVALDELAGAAAVARSLFGNRLVEARRRTAAAVAPQHDLRDARLLSQEFDARLNVERVRLEVDRRLVV